MWGLGELNVVVTDDFYTIAPRVQEIEKRAGQGLDVCVGQRLADRLLVIDDKAKMTAVVGRLRAAPLERNELVAKIDKGGSSALASKREVEQAAIEGQSGFDVTDLQSDMIEPYGTGLLWFS